MVFYKARRVWATARPYSTLCSALDSIDTCRLEARSFLHLVGVTINGFKMQTALILPQAQMIVTIGTVRKWLINQKMKWGFNIVWNQIY